MNTKRVIQYFATISVGGDKKKEQTGKIQVGHFDDINIVDVFNYTSPFDIHPSCKLVL